MISPVNKTFYVNGIITPESGAKETAREIEKLTGLNVEVFHNGAAPLSKIMSIAGKVFYGICGLGYLAFSSKKREEDKEDRMIIGAGSAAALGLGLKEWHDVQISKAEQGKSLAHHVEAYLHAHPNESVRLILHSQGAHVGLSALKHLKHLKGRIHVINLGGMVKIPKRYAAEVTNLANGKDPVPNLIARLTSGPKGWVNLGSDHTSTLLAHEMKEYLTHEKVQALIKGRAITAPAA